MSLALDVPLSEEEYTELDDFLCAGDEEAERLPVDEAHGFMTVLTMRGASPTGWRIRTGR